MMNHRTGSREEWLEARLKFAAFQNPAIGFTEDGNQEFAGKSRIRRLPVDVKESGKQRCLAVFEHIHPPGVVRTHDAHMVGHDIQDLPHAVGAQFGNEALEVRIVGEFRVQCVVINDVVAVQASRAGAEIR